MQHDIQHQLPKLKKNCYTLSPNKHFVTTHLCICLWTNRIAFCAQFLTATFIIFNLNTTKCFLFKFSGYVNRFDNRFYCNVCGRNYLRKPNLMRHMRNECIGVPPKFPCQYCTVKYRRKEDLMHHTKTKHKVVMDEMLAAAPSSNVVRLQMAHEQPTVNVSNTDQLPDKVLMDFPLVDSGLFFQPKWHYGVWVSLAALCGCYLVKNRRLFFIWMHCSAVKFCNPI